MMMAFLAKKRHRPFLIAIFAALLVLGLTVMLAR